MEKSSLGHVPLCFLFLLLVVPEIKGFSYLKDVLIFRLVHFVVTGRG